MTTLTLDDVLPLVLPAGWKTAPYPVPDIPDARKLWNGRLFVLVSLDIAEAGVWLHSSVSRTHPTGAKLPTWDDLKLVHQVVHQDRPVVQVLPPRSSWVSVTECLHLFERLDAPTIPDALWRR